VIKDLIGYVTSLSWGRQAVLAIGLLAGTFIVSLGTVLVVLVRLPVTYFRDDHASPAAAQHPIIRWTGRILKNILGIILILLGLVLSLPGVPGQGLLTVLIGLMLLDFPGKRRLERRLISQPRIVSSVNALRARFGKPRLQLD
jgi:hypothetical protein